MAGPGPGPAGEPMDTSDEIQWCFSQIKGTVDSEEISEGKRQQWQVFIDDLKGKSQCL